MRVGIFIKSFFSDDFFFLRKKREQTASKLTRDGVEGRPSREDDERGPAAAAAVSLLMLVEARGGRGALRPVSVGEGGGGERRGGDVDAG